MDTASPGQDQPRESTEAEQAIVLHDTYRLIRQVGFGGTGVVYEAMHTRLPRRFAIKVLLRSLLAHPEAHARFCHEAELMSQLRHPHVVQIFDFNVTHENQPYFVMEYLEGRDLETELAGGAAMPLSRVVPIVDAVASALMAAHRHGIVHRDLKPSNIFLCDLEMGDGDDAAQEPRLRAEQPFVKVLDFGVSPAGAVTRVSLGTNIVGTPHYMAPEQASGRGKPIDARADQFTLAAITYAMLTGRDPFAGDDMVSVLYQIVHQEAPPLDRYVSGPWDTRRVQQVLNRAMAKDPALRFPAIADFADALREAADHAHAPATPPPVVLTPAPRPAAPLDVPASGQPWTEREITQTIPRVPRLAYRPIVLTLTLVAAIGFVAVKGWVHPLPASVVTTARAWRTRFFGPPARPAAMPMIAVPKPATSTTAVPATTAMPAMAVPATAAPTVPAPVPPTAATAPVTGLGAAAPPAPAEAPILPSPSPSAYPTKSEP